MKKYALLFLLCTVHSTIFCPPRKKQRTSYSEENTNTSWNILQNTCTDQTSSSQNIPEINRKIFTSAEDAIAATVMETMDHFMFNQIQGNQEEVTYKNNLIEKYTYQITPDFIQKHLQRFITETDDKEPLLFKVVENNNPIALKKILDVIGNTYSNLQLKKTGESLLMRAIKNPEGLIIDMLLSYNPLLSKKNIYGDTALHIAIQLAHGSIVKKISDYWKKNSHNTCQDTQFNPNLCNNAGETLLHVAIKSLSINLSCENYIYELISNDTINAATITGDTPLHYAAQTKCPKRIIQKLIEHSTLISTNTIDTKNKAGETALYIALKNEYYDMVDLLIEKGADETIKNDKGETLLHIAVEKKSESTIKKLLNKNPQLINLTTPSGNTPLHYAADSEAKNKLVILLLQNSKANKTIKNNAGQTAQDIVNGQKLVR